MAGNVLCIPRKIRFFAGISAVETAGTVNAVNSLIGVRFTNNTIVNFLGHSFQGPGIDATIYHWRYHCPLPQCPQKKFQSLIQLLQLFVDAVSTA